jgi:hypothetical protein
MSTMTVSTLAAGSTTSQGAVGVASLIAGMLLCFLGVRSLRLAAACAGFGIASGFAAILGAGPALAFVVGAAGAVGGILLVVFVVGVGPFVVGALAGGVLAASVIRTLPPEVGWRPGVATLVVVAVAALTGALVHYVRGPALRAVTALAGAGLVIRGVVEAGPAFLGFLRSPATWVESVVAFAALVALAWAGFSVQHGRADATRP